SRLIEEHKKTLPVDSPEDAIKDVKRARPTKAQDTGVIVKGVDNIKVRFSKCCNPVPGDGIIGYITRGRGVSVHRDDCINVTGSDIEDHRLIEVSWIEADKASYFAEIQVVANDRHALIADISVTIAEMEINVTSINAR